MTFPFDERFIDYLTNDQMLATSTIKDIIEDIDRFFDYLRTNNSSYRTNSDLNEINELDVREYLSWLQIHKKIKNSTYNKVLTHLNKYFIFLFQNHLTTTFPTLGLKSIAKNKVHQISQSIDWSLHLDKYLAMDELSIYTRMMLLLTAHFYQTTEFLQPEFYQVIPKIKWNKNETAFLQKFEKTHQVTAELQQSHALFLKVHPNLANPTLSLPGLHKILKKDQPKVDLELKPATLYQAAIISYLKHHQNLTDEHLMQHLRLSRESLSYYRNLN